MRFTKHLAGTLIMILLLSANVSAEKKSGAVTVAAGLSAPIGPSTMTSHFGIGPNLGFGMGFEVAKYLELEPRIYFSSFPHEDDESLKAFEIGADLKIYTQERGVERLSAYFIAGTGLSYLSYSSGKDLWGSDYNEISKTGSSSSLGANIGFGIEHPIRPGYGFFIDIRYAMDFTEYDVMSYIPVRIGLRFTKRTLPGH